MHFDQTHPPLLFPSNLSPIPQTLCLFLINFFLCCLCECGYRTIYWGQGSLSGARVASQDLHPSTKLILPPPAAINYQQHLSLGVRLHEPLPHPCQDSRWLDIV